MRKLVTCPKCMNVFGIDSAECIEKFAARLREEEERHLGTARELDEAKARAEAAERERDEALDAVGKNIEYSRELRERITRLEKALGAFKFWYESDHEPATGKGNDELQRRLDFAVEKMKAVFPFACGGIVSATTPPTAGAGKVK
jgi:hypothetical protein